MHNALVSMGETGYARIGNLHALLSCSQQRYEPRLNQGRIFAFRGHAKDVQATQAPEIAEIFRSKGDLGLALRNQRHGQRNWTLVTQGSVLLVSDCV
jgi:hypothetical protein